MPVPNPLPPWVDAAANTRGEPRAHLAIGAAGRIPRGLLCGSFNPLHAGHLGMAACAEVLLGEPIDFELAVVNAEKPPIAQAELVSRLNQNFGGRQVWLTNTPNFAEKSRLFPGTTFVLGSDTLQRIGDPRFYQNDAARRDAALRSVQDQGCRFLVFARPIGGKVLPATEVELPPLLAELCTAVPPEVFLSPLASSDLRAQRAR